MVTSVSNETQAQPVAPSTGASSQKPAESQPQSSASDSVQLSKSAQAMLALQQEAQETSVQTAQEASHGDLQARRLLAKEAAEQSSAK